MSEVPCTVKIKEAKYGGKCLQSQCSGSNGKRTLVSSKLTRPARATQRDPVLKGQKGRKEVERNGRKEEGKEEKKRKK